MPNTTISAGPGVIYDENYEPQLGWMEDKGQWGMTATPGKRGLTLEDIQIGLLRRRPGEQLHPVRAAEGVGGEGLEL